MSIITKDLMEAIRRDFEAPTPESISSKSSERKGVMSRISSNVNDTMQSTAASALEGIEDLISTTVGSRSDVDTSEEVDLEKESELDAMVNAIRRGADGINRSLTEEERALAYPSKDGLSNEDSEVISTDNDTVGAVNAPVEEESAPVTAESAPVTRMTQGAGLMSPPVGDDAEVDFDGEGLPFSMGTTTEEGRPAVKETQSRLRQLGYYKNRVDGLTGKGTESALKTFQYNNGLDVTGIADDSTRALLSQTSGLTAQPTPKTTLLKYISEGEGGYGAANNGTSKLAKKFSMSDGYFSDSVNKPLTGMSVNELMNAQMGTTGKTTEELLKMNPESTSAQKKRKVFAVGAYQIIPKTMWSAVKSGAIEGDTIFSPKTQDKIAMDFLAGSDRPKLRDFLAGNPNVSVEDAMLSLAQQWASAPAHKDMTTSGGRKIKKGDSYYGSGNKALHTVEETKAMLLKARDENVL